MAQRTPLYDAHISAGGRMVDFGGWQLPIHYGSQIQEHHAVRGDAGMFDVSHMTLVDIEGDAAFDYLRRLLANDIGRLELGKALYTCMLTEQGTVIDDLIVYFLADNRYRLVLNAATRDKDLAWLTKQVPASGVQISARPDLAMLAVQGPTALDKVAGVVSLPVSLAELAKFSAYEHEHWLIARTGYTGEDGVEIMLPADEIEPLWSALIQQGVQVAGLGARDTLRLEAGMNLYGSDMDEQCSPLQCGLAWTVAWQPQDRDFIGRQPLQQEREQGVQQKQVGLLLLEKGVLRAGQEVSSDAGAGIVTSGTFSPTLQKSIALARVPFEVEDQCQVCIRGKALPARVVKPPFVRNGKSLID